MNRKILLLVCLLPFISAYNVLHISDVHYLEEYAVGSPDKCVLGSTGMGCCRKDVVPIPGWSPAGENGDYNCDSPLKLINDTLSWIHDNLEIDLVLFTGDIVDHNLLHQTPEYVLEEIAIVTALFRFYFENVIFTLGNHDGIIDQDNSSMLEDVYSLWKDVVPKEFVSQKGNWRTRYGEINITVVNSLLYDSNNLVNQSTEVDYLFDFLDNGTTNWIVGHIPPGDGGYNFTDRYSELLSVTGFFGHTHRSRFSLTNGKVIYIVGSVVPDKHNPLFRVYNVSSLGEVYDYTEYYMPSLDETSYEVLYSARESYGLENLDFSEWYNFAIKMKTNQTLFDLYYSHMNVPFNQTCDDDCRIGVLSDIFV